MPDEASSNDLPMSANLQDITVKHFALDLVCKMEDQVFEGTITLWCLPTVKLKEKRTGEMALTGEGASVPLTKPVGGIVKGATGDGEWLEKDLRSGECLRNSSVMHEAEQVQCTESESETSKCERVEKSIQCTNQTAELSFLTASTASESGSRGHHTEALRSIDGKDHKAHASHKEQRDNVGHQDPQDPIKHFPVMNSARHISEPFKMILDSYKLDVKRVEGVFLQQEEKLLFEENPDVFVRQINQNDPVSWTHQQHPMDFLVKEHCIHISTQTVCTVDQFPQAVRIWYSTRPDGPSLKWTTDQDGKACVFTIGHFLSNRSLFPSQDFPTALPTWHAAITVDGGLTVLLTGDKEPQVTTTESGSRRFSYFTHFPMPSSTFAIAVGAWGVDQLTYLPLHDDVAETVSRPPVRLFSSRQLKERSMSVLGEYLPHCMLAAQRMLGTYPFHRLDVLVVPACFDSLGLASPSLLFLSQSILCPDGSMRVQVAHELCHTWFGIVIGPQDWTEEWLTEGFCTYLEDLLHAQISQPVDTSEDNIRLRAELHLRVLKAELQNTDENLQSLRPNKGIVDEAQSSTEGTRFLKNGMNLEKKFMQVHYLKGYFLLRALEREVGRDRFLTFLKNYVQKYIYQLVTSQDFLQMFFNTFPDVKHLSEAKINAQWLDCPGLPEALDQTEDGGCLSVLAVQVDQQLAVITQACRHQTRRKRRRGRQPHHQLPTLHQMQTLQVVLLFDRLLEEERVPGHILDLLKRVHSPHLDNAEVCHRWCELVVKHRHKKCYSDLRHFLLNHQALGVYLYGEAMISECPDVIQLARACFRQLQHDMPDGVRETVSALLYAT